MVEEATRGHGGRDEDQHGDLAVEDLGLRVEAGLGLEDSPHIPAGSEGSHEGEATAGISTLAPSEGPAASGDSAKGQCPQHGGEEVEPSDRGRGGGAAKADGTGGQGKGGEEEEEEEEEEDGNAQAEAGGKKKAAAKRRKKRKGKKRDGGPAVAFAPLPSQPLVEQAFPWVAIVKPKRGRCAVASRALKAGEVVVAESALVFLPREEYAGAVCHACCHYFVDNQPIVQCTVCAYAVFCTECKFQALREHRNVCGLGKAIAALARQADCSADLLRLVAALALLTRRPLPPASPPLSTARILGLAGESLVETPAAAPQGSVKGGVIHPCHGDAMALCEHYQKVPAAWRASVRKGCEGLLAAALAVEAEGGTPTPPGGGSALLGTVEQLERLAALVNTNAHGMGADGPFNTDVALGIFPFVSLLNHSCRPNCCFASKGSVMYVRAMEDVPAGTELCLSYINLYEPRSVRQEELRTSKHFECACDRCSEPMASSPERFLEGVLCKSKGCGGVLLRSSSLRPEAASAATWECDTCRRVLDPGRSAAAAAAAAVAPNGGESGGGGRGCERPWEAERSAREAMAAAMAVYRERKHDEARALLERLLADFTGILHPLHVLLFDARTPLMNCCRATGDAAEGIRQCLAILEAMQAVTPWQAPEAANFWAALAEMYQERAATPGLPPAIARRFKKQSQEALQRAKAIRLVCLGRT